MVILGLILLIVGLVASIPVLTTIGLILIVVGLILAGGLYFAKMLIFNREILETEPGHADAF